MAPWSPPAEMGPWDDTVRLPQSGDLCRVTTELSNTRLQKSLHTGDVIMVVGMVGWGLPQLAGALQASEHDRFYDTGPGQFTHQVTVLSSAGMYFTIGCIFGNPKRGDTLVILGQT